MHGNCCGLVRPIRKSDLGLVSPCFTNRNKLNYMFMLFRQDYAALPAEGVLINLIGVFLLCFGVLSLYLVNDISYKRNSLPEENMTLADNEEHHEQVEQ